MANDRDYRDHDERERNRARRSARSGSQSPRRKEREPRDRYSEKYRYTDADTLNSRSEPSSSGHSKRTRWDVGDPEREREQSRVSPHSTSRSPDRKRPRYGHEGSPQVGRHERKHGSSRRRSRTRSSSSESSRSDSSDSTHRRSRSRHRSKHSRGHRKCSPLSVSLSSSRSRSRSRERHGKSKDKGRRKRSARHKEKRKRSRSSERRSVLTGKKIKMKVHKTADDHERDAKREELLKFLNSAFE